MKTTELARQELVYCLFEDSEKYRKIREVLEKYIDDPDDVAQVQDLCVRAGADKTLDGIMNRAGVDTLDDLDAKIEEWKTGSERHGVYEELDRLAKSTGFTDLYYWDCKCDGDCVHPKTETRCDKCGTKFDNDDPDIPDSHRTEVVSHIKRVLSKAEILCAMDCLMHHLSDEDAIEPWLANGVPDGMDWTVLDYRTGRERTAEFMELAESMSDEDFEDMVRLFAATIRRECFETKYSRKALC